MIFQNQDELICPSSPSSAMISMWKKDQILHQWKASPLDAGTCYYLGWSANLPPTTTEELPNKIDGNNMNRRLWICDESGIHNIPLHSTTKIEQDWNTLLPDYNLMYHVMTCCGVDQHSNRIVAGDFMGNVIIWQENETEPFDSINVLSPVRTVCWNTSKSSIQIGCLDGKVFEWLPGVEGSLKLLFSLMEGVTCLRWSYGNASNLAATTTDGK
jgi:hypothetical protein